MLKLTINFVTNNIYVSFQDTLAKGYWTMMEKKLNGSYQPAKPYFPERNLRKEAQAVLMHLSQNLDSIKSSRLKRFQRNHYSEDRFITRIVDRIFTQHPV